MYERILAAGVSPDSDSAQLLQEAGYLISCVSNENEAALYARNHPIDMLILDRIESSKLIKRLIKSVQREQKDRRYPVLILINSEHDTSVVEGFEAGANDVILHPFATQEVLARIRNLLDIFQVTERQGDQNVNVRDITIDPKSRSVLRGETQIILTAKEFDLLLYLARHAGQVCTREEILKRVWDYDFDMGTNVVDVYIRHLRKKLDAGYRKKLIHTVRGVGYIIKEGQ